MNENISVSPVLVPIVVIIVVFSFTAAMAWLAARRKEREAYYRSETVKKIAEGPGGGASAIEWLREQERIASRRRQEGQKLGGLISMAVGAGMMVFLKMAFAANANPTARQTYLVGLIPLLVGVVLLAYSFFFAPKD
jgi:hypothetical protein